MPKKRAAKKSVTAAQAPQNARAVKAVSKRLKELNLKLKQLEKELGIIFHDPFLCGPPKPKE